MLNLLVYLSFEKERCIPSATKKLPTAKRMNGASLKVVVLIEIGILLGGKRLLTVMIARRHPETLMRPETRTVHPNPINRKSRSSMMGYITPPYFTK